MDTFTAEQELKLFLLANGVRIDPDAERTWGEMYGGPLSLSEYASTSGICIYTQGDVYVNAPFIEEFTKDTEAQLVYEDGFAVVWQGNKFPVSVIPVPAYHQLTYSDKAGVFPYTNLGVTHTDRCRISPVEGCDWVCTFCDIPYELKYRTKSKEDLLRVIELAKSDPLAPARHVLISGGTPKPEDEPWYDDVVAFIAGNSPLPVDVMMPPRHDLDYPRWLRSVGVNMISINVEIWDTQRAKRITPNKARIYGRDFYLRYIEEGVKAFGVGFVQSLMVFGSAIEPVESTLEGVKALAERGCIPVLSPFRPDPTTAMGRQPPASLEEMRRAYVETQEICARVDNGVKPGPRCVPCHHNTVAFPDGSDFYVPLTGDLTKGLSEYEPAVNQHQSAQP